MLLFTSENCFLKRWETFPFDGNRPVKFAPKNFRSWRQCVANQKRIFSSCRFPIMTLTMLIFFGKFLICNLYSFEIVMEGQRLCSPLQQTLTRTLRAFRSGGRFREPSWISRKFRRGISTLEIEKNWCISFLPFWKFPKFFSGLCLLDLTTGQSEFPILLLQGQH